MEKINSLQFVRAIACLIVLLTHVLQLSNYKPFGDYFVSGGYGVDLFFMLSGFLIYLTTKDGGNSKEFAVKRLFRIYPLYWVVYFAFLFYTIVYLNKTYKASVLLYFAFLFYTIVYLNKTYKASVLLQNFLMFPWSNSLTTRSLIVGVAWSTVFELYFYFVIFLFLFLKIKKKYAIVFLFLVPLLFKINRTFSIIELSDSSNFIVSIIGTMKIIPFILGALIAHFNQNFNKLNDVLPSIKITLFVLINLSFFFISFTEYSSYKSFLICFLMFLSWLYVDNILRINYDLFVSKFFLKIGDISFSIYLIHTLVIEAVIYFCSFSNIFYTTILSYCISISLSYLTYKYIETPFMNFAKYFVALNNKRLVMR